MSTCAREAAVTWHRRTRYGILVTMQIRSRSRAQTHSTPHVRTSECPECLGSGLAPNRKDFCPRCGGLGQVPRAA